MGQRCVSTQKQVLTSKVSLQVSINNFHQRSSKIMHQAIEMDKAEDCHHIYLARIKKELDQRECFSWILILLLNFEPNSTILLPRWMRKANWTPHIIRDVFVRVRVKASILSPLPTQLEITPAQKTMLNGQVPYKKGLFLFIHKNKAAPSIYLGRLENVLTIPSLICN